MKLTPTKVLHYGLLLVAAYIVYSWLTKESGGRDPYDNHPRNKDKFRDDDVRGKGHRYADDVRHVGDDDQVVDRQSKHGKTKKPTHKEKPRRQEDDERRVKYDKYDKEKGKRNIKHENSEKPVRANIHRQQEKDDIEKIDSGQKIGNLKRDIEDKVAIDKMEKELEMEDDKYNNEEEDTDIGDIGQKFKLKVKGKKDEGVDMLKEINDAELEGDLEVQKQIDKLSDHVNVKIPKLKKEWHEDHDDMEVAMDKTERRKQFFEKVRALEVNQMMQEDIHIHEQKNDFTFVTAAYSETFKSALTFIHSVQMNFPDAQIGIMDVGLTEDEVTYLKTICNVVVVENFLFLYPKFLIENMAQKLWRPVVLQVALNRFGHFVYVDVNRFLKKGADLRGHFDLSRKGGAAMFGTKKSYSSFVVTHPEMYYYLAINVNKLLKLQHMEINVMILHGSEHIRHFFMRWMLMCSIEEYCIAPPGAKRKCDLHLYPGSRYYADCHRYDESIINVLLASWHKYDFDHYAAQDYITQHYDGRDSKRHLKFCLKPAKDGL